MFESARLKIERADHHIGDLERQLSRFTRQNLDASMHQRDDGKLDITLTASEPPPSLALIIGDAVHNLWSAMDYVIWEMIGLDRGRQHPQLYCPKGRDRASYEGLCNGIETPSASVKRLLVSLEIFSCGAGHFLYVVSRLDNADKHSALTPVVNAPNIDELVLTSEGGKVRRVLSDLYGGPVRLRQGETFTIVGADSGASLAFKNEAQISPHILFGNVEFVQNEPVFPTLLQLRHAVSNAIDIVDRSAAWK